jgi:hypothetical protein
LTVIGIAFHSVGSGPLYYGTKHVALGGEILVALGLKACDWFARSRSLSPAGFGFAPLRQPLSLSPRRLKSADLEVCAAPWSRREFLIFDCRCQGGAKGA